MKWFYIFSANLTQSRELTIQDLGIDKSSHYVFYDWKKGPSPSTLKPIDNQNPLYLPANIIPPWNNFTNCTYPPCNQTIDFSYYILAPMLSNGWAILGESGKVTVVSSQRIKQVELKKDSIRVVCMGSEGEKISMSFLSPNQNVLQGIYR